MRRSFGAVKLYSIAAACGLTWRAFVTSCSTCSGGGCLRLPLSFKSKTTFAGTANASIKKPPLDRKSAQKWLTVLNYGQFWKSPKTPGVFNYGVLNYGVLIYDRFKLWPLQYVAQNPIPRPPNPPATPPLFVVSTPQNRPNGRLATRTSGHLVQPEGSPARARWGPTVGPPVSPGAKKNFFPKLFLDHLGARFEPVGARFGPWKIPKCLENGPFQDQKWVENGSKMCFSESDLGPFGMLKQVLVAHFEPVVTHFGPWKIP